MMVSMCCTSLSADVMFILATPGSPWMPSPTSTSFSPSLW